MSFGKRTTDVFRAVAVAFAVVALLAPLKLRRLNCCSISCKLVAVKVDLAEACDLLMPAARDIFSPALFKFSNSFGMRE